MQPTLTKPAQPPNWPFGELTPQQQQAQAELLKRQADKASPRRFTGAPITAFGALS
jgi:hypothetical protein